MDETPIDGVIDERPKCFDVLERKISSEIAERTPPLPNSA